MSLPEKPENAPGWPSLLEKIRARTPARVLVDRAGAAYLTSTQLELRHAHAAARDAVRAELDIEKDLGADFIGRWKLFEVCTLAASKEEYLLRPDLGRSLDESARQRVETRCPKDCGLQIVLGDGLSVTALSTQAPKLLPEIVQRAVAQGWTVGQPFVIRHCRVGVMNDLGALLRPKVLVLLIGERPGLATAESLSAYMAFRPHAGHTDADRNLISNIHARGVATEAAAQRIVTLAARMMAQEISGVHLKEQFPEMGSKGLMP